MSSIVQDFLYDFSLQKYLKNEDCGSTALFDVRRCIKSKSKCKSVLIQHLLYSIMEVVTELKDCDAENVTDGMEILIETVKKLKNLIKRFTQSGSTSYSTLDPILDSYIEDSIEMLQALFNADQLSTVIDEFTETSRTFVKQCKKCLGLTSMNKIYLYYCKRVKEKATEESCSSADKHQSDHSEEEEAISVDATSNHKTCEMEDCTSVTSGSEVSIPLQPDVTSRTNIPHADMPHTEESCSSADKHQSDHSEEEAISVDATSNHKTCEMEDFTSVTSGSEVSVPLQPDVKSHTATSHTDIPHAGTSNTATSHTNIPHASTPNTNDQISDNSDNSDAGIPDSSKKNLKTKGWVVGISPRKIRKRNQFTLQSDVKLIHGIINIGEGMWTRILKAYSFPIHRKAGHLKDRWRTMKERGIASVSESDEVKILEAEHKRAFQEYQATLPSKTSSSQRKRSERMNKKPLSPTSSCFEDASSIHLDAANSRADRKKQTSSNHGDNLVVGERTSNKVSTAITPNFHDSEPKETLLVDEVPGVSAETSESKRKKRKRLWDGDGEMLTWDDDPILQPASESFFGIRKQSQQHRKPWVDWEVQNLIKGIRRFGVGQWSMILDQYRFQNRTAVMLKDKYRNLHKHESV